MITSNVIHRVFRIRYGTAVGTAFTIEVAGREYLVTARHIVGGQEGEAEIEVFANNIWESWQTCLVGHGEGEKDVSVLALTKPLTTVRHPLSPTPVGIMYGQDVYFLGFPYGFLGHFTLGPDGLPFPFVKKACVSMLNQDGVLLDGHNNPGFSGAPVVFTLPGRLEYRVAAVISSYRTVKEKIYDGQNPTHLNYKYNTGIIEAYSIQEAVRLIEANPIGLLLPLIE